MCQCRRARPLLAALNGHAITFSQVGLNIVLLVQAGDTKFDVQRLQHVGILETKFNKKFEKVRRSVEKGHKLQVLHLHLQLLPHLPLLYPRAIQG